MSFLAKYPGICVRCGGRFGAGTEVEYAQDESGAPDFIVETHCPGEHVDLREIGRRPDNVCAKCYTIHAGECL